MYMKAIYGYGRVVEEGKMTKSGQIGCLFLVIFGQNGHFLVKLVTKMISFLVLWNGSYQFPTTSVYKQVGMDNWWWKVQMRNQSMDVRVLWKRRNDKSWSNWWSNLHCLGCNDHIKQGLLIEQNMVCLKWWTKCKNKKNMDKGMKKGSKKDDGIGLDLEQNWSELIIDLCSRSQSSIEYPWIALVQVLQHFWKHGDVCWCKGWIWNGQTREAKGKSVGKKK